MLDPELSLSELFKCQSKRLVLIRVIITYASDDAQESRFETSDIPIVSDESHQEISIGSRVTRGRRQSSILTISLGSPSLLWLSDEM